jgi:hypothetical protein
MSIPRDNAQRCRPAKFLAGHAPTLFYRPSAQPQLLSLKVGLLFAIACFFSGCDRGKPAADPGGESQSSGNGSVPSSEGVPANSPFHFVDRTVESSASFEYRNGEESGHFSILESLGGGVSPIDLDLDGYDDLCFAGGGTFSGQAILPAKTGMFRRRSEWKWDDVAGVSGVADSSYYSHGAIRTDFDLDGMPDILMTGYGGIQLFRNQGDGTFQKLSQEIGLTDTKWSSSAAVGDLNGDSSPDIYVAHYVDWSWENHPFCKGGPGESREVCPPKSFTGLTDSVFFSHGDGTFRDATLEAGLTEEGKGLGVVMADLDVDGDNDVYVTNDTVANFLYENDQNQKLTDVSLASGASLSGNGRPDGSMGVDACDFNLDGIADLWVVNYEREINALYQGSGAMAFRHVSQRVGLSAIGGMYVGWGTTCQDFDLDGDEDIFVSNGHVIRYPENAPLRQTPLLLNNLNGGRFENVAATGGTWMTDSHMGRGACAADWDRDGDMDLAVSCTGETSGVLDNRSERKGNWLGLRLIGIDSSRDPVGATITLKSSRPQTRYVKSGGSYGGSPPDYVIFGMPDAPDAVVVEILWPSGKTMSVRVNRLNQYYVIREASEGAGDASVFTIPY